MKYFILMLVAVAAVSAVPDQVVNLAAENPQLMANLFSVFGAQHHRHYATPQEARLRLKLFRDFVKFAAALNAEYPEVEYGVTRFADRTDAEREAMTGLNTTTLSLQTEKGPVGEELPLLGYVNHQARYGPVKNQGNSNCCWAFAATAVVEGAQSLLTGRYTSLSDQMTTDCSPGCSPGLGGDPSDALGALIKRGTLATSKDYPYRDSKMRQRCKKDKRNALKIEISKVTQAAETDSGVANALQHHGPITVIMGFDKVLSAYKSGIHTDNGCNTMKSPNHAVAAVGYTRDYWLIRNSYGTGWGERGYGRITRKVPNMCKIAEGAWWITAKRDSDEIDD